MLPCPRKPNSLFLIVSLHLCIYVYMYVSVCLSLRMLSVCLSVCLSAVCICVCVYMCNIYNISSCFPYYFFFFILFSIMLLLFPFINYNSFFFARKNQNFFSFTGILSCVTKTHSIMISNTILIILLILILLYPRYYAFINRVCR